MTGNTEKQSKVVGSLVKILGLKNDAELARKLEISAPNISKIRTGKLPVGASFILAVHEVFGLPVADIRRLAGSPSGRPPAKAGAGGTE